MALTTSTLKCVSPFPPPCARIAACPACAAESFETTSKEGCSAAVICEATGGQPFGERRAPPPGQVRTDWRMLSSIGPRYDGEVENARVI